MTDQPEALRAYTTLKKIRAHGPCADGWAELLHHLRKTQADDEPLPLATILDANGFDDTVWCLRAVDGHHREMRLFAVWCARQVQHMMADPRSLAALNVAERHAAGKATDEELAAARAAAWDAARDAADAARAAARDAAWAAARDAAEAAWDAARDAADAARAAAEAAWDAAMDAAEDAARAAAEAAWDAAEDAARAAARREQEREFRRMFCGGDR